MAIFSERTAILVDGGFYRLQAKKLFGKKDPEERADELFLLHASSEQRK